MRRQTPSQRAGIERSKQQTAMEEASEKRREELEGQYANIFERYADGRADESARALAQIESDEMKAKGKVWELYNASYWDYASMQQKRIITAQEADDRILAIESDSQARRAALVVRPQMEAASNQATEATAYYQMRAGLYMGSPGENISGQLGAQYEKLTRLQQIQGTGGLSLKDWNDVQKQIDEVTRSLTPLQVKLVEINGTFAEGIAGGFRQWLYTSQTAYGAGASVVTGTANAMQSGLSRFFDYSGKGWMNYKSLVTGVMHEIYMEMVKAMVVRPIVGGAMSALGMGAQGAQGAGGGGWGSAGGFAGLISRIFGGGGMPDQTGINDSFVPGQPEGGMQADFYGTVPYSGSGMVPVEHSGGVIGQGGTYRSYPSHLWDTAARYHSGGLAGDEVAAVLQKGEQVIPKGGVGGPVINFEHNVTNANGSKVTNSPPRWDVAAKKFIVDTMIEDHVNDGDYSQARRTWSSPQ